MPTVMEVFDVGVDWEIREALATGTPPVPKAEESGLRERLAELCHEQWTDWMRYMFSRTSPANGGMLIPAAWVERWQRQMDTPYARLSAREQDSDRKEADRFIAALKAPAPKGE